MRRRKTLLLPGCGGARTGGGEEARLTILASTYPVYLAARAVTDGVDGVAVERLNTGEVSCLHDYTLTVTDMKKIEPPAPWSSTARRGCPSWRTPITSTRRETTATTTATTTPTTGWTRTTWPRWWKIYMPA